MTLLEEVDRFYLAHREHGDVENRSPADGSRIVLACSCRAVLNRGANGPT